MHARQDSRRRGQAALKLWVDEDTGQARKYFSLSAAYAEYRDYRPNPQGLGLHGLEIAPGEVIRLTHAEVEAHPAWRGFGDEAGKHPPLRGWLASAVCGEGGRRYGLLQLSDKRGGADFTEEDADSVRELAALVGETLDALRAASRYPGPPAPRSPCQESQSEAYEPSRATSSSCVPTS